MGYLRMKGLRSKGIQAADQMKEFLQTVKVGFEEAQAEYVRLEEKIEMQDGRIRELENQLSILRSEFDLHHTPDDMK